MSSKEKRSTPLLLGMLDLKSCAPLLLGQEENSREAKYYTITRAGLKALNEETERWRQMAGVVEKLLAEEQ